MEARYNIEYVTNIAYVRCINIHRCPLLCDKDFGGKYDRRKTYRQGGETNDTERNYIEGDQ